jgi:hypothetical protein
MVMVSIACGSSGRSGESAPQDSRDWISNVTAARLGIVVVVVVVEVVVVAAVEVVDVGADVVTAIAGVVVGGTLDVSGGVVVAG